MNQADCQAAADANCVNGASANDVNGKTMWIEAGAVGGAEYNEIEALVDQGNMDFWGVNGLPIGCYVLKGNNGSAYYFYKTVAGSLSSLASGDSNICLAGKMLNLKLYDS